MLGALQTLVIVGSIYVVWAFIDPHPFRYLYLSALLLGGVFLVFRERLLGLTHWLLFWIFFMFGMTEILTEGVNGAQVLLFVFATFFLAIVKGTPGTLTGLAICSAAMLTVAAMLQTGYLSLYPGFNGVPLSWSRWLDELLNLLLVGGASGTAITVLMNNLAESLFESRGLVERLEKEVQARDAAIEQSRESEALYQLLADNFRDVVFTLFRYLLLTYVSPSVLQQRGFTREEVIERDLLEDISEATRSGVVEAYTRILADLEQGVMAPYYEVEYEVLHKDGRHIWVEGRVSALLDENGEPTSLLGVNRDMTERREAEKDRQLLENQFMHMQRIESVGQLAGGVAHDFNNILVAINGYAQLSLENDLPEEDRENLERILKAAERASKLTNQLLAFSRRQIFDLRTINLNDLISNLNDMLERLIRKDITLMIRLPSEPCHVKADAGQLEQVIVILVVNGRDAMENGGDLVVSLDVVPGENVQGIGIPEAPTGEFARLVVRDHGHGIPEGAAEHIFEPFFTTKSPDAGTGLGLSTVFGIVTQHKGFVTPVVRTDGADFVVYLPLVSAFDAEADGDEADEASLEADGRATILVVEDDAEVRAVTTKILSNANYQLHVAEDGIAAIDLWRQHGNEIDLILLDMMMPRMNGREVLDRIRQAGSKVPVLLCSGYYDTVETGQVWDEHVDLLKKPYESGELLSRIRQSLHRATADSTQT